MLTAADFGEFGCYQRTVSSTCAGAFGLPTHAMRQV
jgi:hypothetical protein